MQITAINLSTVACCFQMVLVTIMYFLYFAVFHMFQKPIQRDLAVGFGTKCTMQV